MPIMWMTVLKELKESDCIAKFIKKPIHLSSLIELVADAIFGTWETQYGIMLFSPIEITILIQVKKCMRTL